MKKYGSVIGGISCLFLFLLPGIMSRMYPNQTYLLAGLKPYLIVAGLIFLFIGRCVTETKLPSGSVKVTNEWVEIGFGCNYPVILKMDDKEVIVSVDTDQKIWIYDFLRFGGDCVSTDGVNPKEAHLESGNFSILRLSTGFRVTWTNGEDWYLVVLN